MRAGALWLMVLLVSAAAPTSWGQDRAPVQPDVEASLEAELREIDAKSAEVKDLAAKFEQTKKTPLLRKPLVSSGTVKVKGALVRWDTEKPHKASMLIDESQIRMYYPDQRVMEEFDIDESMRRITASPLPRLAVIREQFLIARADPKDLGVARNPERYVAVSLSPREDSLRKHIERVRVLIERATACAVKVEMTDADGDTTVIDFTDIRTNVGLNEKELALTVPEGTKVVKPLAGLRGGAAPEPPGTVPKSGGRP